MTREELQEMRDATEAQARRLTNFQIALVSQRLKGDEDALPIVRAALEHEVELLAHLDALLLLDAEASAPAAKPTLRVQVRRLSLPAKGAV